MVFVLLCARAHAQNKPENNWKISVNKVSKNIYEITLSLDGDSNPQTYFNAMPACNYAFFVTLDSTKNKSFTCSNGNEMNAKLVLEKVSKLFYRKITTDRNVMNETIYYIIKNINK